MAKGNKEVAQNNKKSNHGKNNSDVRGDVSQNIKNTELGKARVRNERKQLEKVRAKEQEEGTFHLRVNTGRSNNIMEVVSGQLGLYAFPGGNEPSIHLEVRTEVTHNGPLSVITLQSVQQGHELSGEVFDPLVYLPAFYINRFGSSFESRMNDGLAAKTQNLLCHFLADLKIKERGTVPVEEVEEETAEDMFPQVITNPGDMGALVDGVNGLYGLKDDDGNPIILEVYGERGAIRVVASSSPSVLMSRAYLYAYLLKRKTLEQMVNDETYAHQLDLFTFLQSKLAHLFLKKEPVQAPAPKETMKKPVTPKEGMTQEVFELVRKHLISASEAATGKLGYVDLSDQTGEIIIQFAKKGNDHIAEIVYLAKKHMLVLAGLSPHSFVYAGQIMTGSVSNCEAATLRMSQEDVRKANALIGYIRARMEKQGVRIPQRKRPNLRLAA